MHRVLKQSPGHYKWFSEWYKVILIRKQVRSETFVEKREIIRDQGGVRESQEWSGLVCNAWTLKWRSEIAVEESVGENRLGPIWEI